MERGWIDGLEDGGLRKEFNPDALGVRWWPAQSVSAPSKVSIHIPFNFTADSYRARAHIEL